MKIHNVIKAALLIGLASCATLVFADDMTNNSAATMASSAAPVTDADIVSGIKGDIAKDPMTKGLKVEVTSDKGVVKLAGNVDTDAEASKLTEIADSISGVSDVDIDKLTVKKSKHPLTDSIITAKVKGTFAREKLFDNKDVAMMKVKVITTNGIVYLSGTVNNAVEASNAIKLAQTVSGVKSVKSRVTVKAKK